MSTIAVVGTGYVGQVTAVGMAAWGHEVRCADIDPEKVAQLQRGVPTIYEEGLQTLLGEALENNRISFVLGAANAVADAEFVFMCLPTPQMADGEADLRFLLSAAIEIGPHLQPGTIVINKSTVPVGSAELVRQAIQREDVHVASNPEFLQEGIAFEGFFNPDRVVIGTDDEVVGKRIASLYSPVYDRVQIIGTREAELVKYASNCMLAARLSMVSMIDRIAEGHGADAREVLRVVGLDKRIGPAFLNIGSGYGGSCFPKDVEALIKIAERVGADPQPLRATVLSNEAQISFTVDKICELLGEDLTGKHIAAWGLTFKPNTDDTRESTALAVIRGLIDRGATVRAYDPQAANSGMPEVNFSRKDSALEACTGADALVLLTAWPEFKQYDATTLRSLMRGTTIADTTDILPNNFCNDFAHYTLGRGMRD